MAARVTRFAVLAVGITVACLASFAVGGFAGGAMGHGFGGAGMHLAMTRLVDDLDLNTGQQERLDAVHGILSGHFEGMQGAKEAHHQLLVERIQAGNLDPTEVRQSIDQHLEEARSLAYQVADEVVPLVNSLDDTQRAKLLDFIADVEAAHAGGHPPCAGSPDAATR